MKIYRENITQYKAKGLRLTKKSNRISTLRLVTFIFSCMLTVSLVYNGLYVLLLIFFILFIIGFAFLVVSNNKIDFLKRHVTFLKDINEAEILRFKCLLQYFDNGEEFVNKKHHYSSDLDIFGNHSLFQLVNRTTTKNGKELLAEWLTEKATAVEIVERQNAIKELSEKLNWRQNFQATGMHYSNEKSNYSKFMEWVNEPIVLLRNQKIYFSAAIVLSILSLLAFVFFWRSLFVLNFYIALLPISLVLFINGRVIKSIRPHSESIVEISHNDLQTMKGYEALIKKFSTQTFYSKKLLKLQSSLTVSGNSSVKEIRALFRLLEFAMQRVSNKIPIGGNLFYSIFNIFFLWDIYLVISSEKWKSKNKIFINSWIMAISELEVLNSLAGFCFSNPAYEFPELNEKFKSIKFEQLGHPLIDPDKRVYNDFQIHKNGQVSLITGSNMAGKSTFLRTVGINLVLAQIGAPCCARTGQLTVTELFTSMRTQDNLGEGFSSFSAELDRISKLIDLIAMKKNVFFLLDEIFKGTNSEDRFKGGFSLINQLKGLNASGLIATHDIRLAKLAEEKNLITNYSFNSVILNGKMCFAYNLDAGICMDFNASELMRNHGIHILNNISSH